MEKQLASVNVEEARRKWAANEPVNLREFAVAQGIGYSLARSISQKPGFPFFGLLVYREDFTLWRQSQLGLVPAVASSPMPARRRRSTAGRSEK